MMLLTHQPIQYLAKPGITLASWHQAHFSSAILPDSTRSTARSVSHGENAPGTQVRNEQNTSRLKEIKI